MPYVGASCKLMGHRHSRRVNSNDVVYFSQHFNSSLKTTLDIGICAWSPSLCRLFVFFKPDYAKDPDAHSHKSAVE
jgi:hypothetical protein